MKDRTQTQLTAWRRYRGDLVARGHNQLAHACEWCGAVVLLTRKAAKSAGGAKRWRRDGKVRVQIDVCPRCR